MNKQPTLKLQITWVADINLTPLQKHIVVSSNVCWNTIIVKPYAIATAQELLLDIWAVFLLELLRGSVPVVHRLDTRQLSGELCPFPALVLLGLVVKQYVFLSWLLGKLYLQKSNLNDFALCIVNANVDNSIPLCQFKT